MCSAVKLPGRRSPIVVSSVLPSVVASVTLTSRGPEFRQLLPASPAGWDRMGAVRDHRDLGQARFARGDHRGDGTGLGAGSFRVSHVLDVATDIDHDQRPTGSRRRP